MSAPADQLDWGNFRRPDVASYYDTGMSSPAELPEPEDVEWADYAKTVMSGGASLVQASGWLARVLGAEDLGTSIETLGSDAVDFWHDRLSDPAKAEMAKQVIRKNEQTGEYEWGDPSFSTIGLMGAESLLGTAAGMGAGAGLTKVLQVFANPFGRATLEAGRKAGSAAATKKLKLVDTVLGATGFGLGEGSVGGISAGASVYDNIMRMDPEKLMANDRYRQVFESTDNSISELERHQYAADTVAKEASTAAGWQSGLTTALLGAPMGAYFGRILGGARLASTLPRAIATGAAGEAAQEFAQSGVEQYISNVQTMPFDPDIDPFDDVLNAAVSGALAGGLLGGVVGPAAVGGARAEIAAEDAGKQVEARKERADYLRKIGGPLQDAARQAIDEAVEADKPVAAERASRIVADWAAEKISMPEALELMNARVPAETVSEAAEEAQPEAEQPVEVEEKAAEPTPEEFEQRVEREAQAPTAIETVDPTTLTVNAPLMQFKAQTDKEGVSDALKGVKRFETFKAGLAIVWERLNGERVVADGHQRVGLAKRAIAAGQDPAEVRMAAYVVREADGWTAEKVRAEAALKNIAEQTGSPIDAAKVIRDMGPEAQPAIDNLPPTRELVKQGKALAKLDEEAFQKVVNEVINAKHGAIVGELIPEDADMQNAAIEVLRQTEPANATQARAIVEQVRTAGVEVQETEDLFGANVVAESLYIERAKVLDAALRAARRDKTTFRTLIKREGAITGTGKNVLDRAANEAKISDADRALAILTAAANTKGPISDALTAAASRVKAGERQGAVAQDFLAEAMQTIQGDGQPSRVARQPEPRQQPEITGELAAEGLYSRRSEEVDRRREYIGQQIDELVAGRDLMELSEEERAELHDLQLQLPGTGEEQQAAKDRLAERAANRRREALEQEEARRDRIRNTGQLPLFSRAGKPLNEIIMTFEVETETGEVFEVEQSADIMLRQLDNRRNAIQQLRNCIRG